MQYEHTSDCLKHEVVQLKVLHNIELIMYYQYYHSRFDAKILGFHSLANAILRIKLVECNTRDIHVNFLVPL